MVVLINKLKLSELLFTLGTFGSLFVRFCQVRKVCCYIWKSNVYSAGNDFTLFKIVLFVRGLIWYY